MSERVAIGEQIEALLGERRGRPSEKMSENFNELKGKRTDDLAAEKAGFGNYNTYRQAKQVVEEGSFELVSKMDAGEIAISVAAELTSLDEQEQDEALARGENFYLQKAKEQTENFGRNLPKLNPANERGRSQQKRRASAI